jgi:hypothetical protein
MRSISLILLLLNLNAFAQNTQCIEERYSADPIFTEAEIEVESNLQYGTAEHYWTGVNTPLLMDIYHPNAAIDPVENRPFILVVHGGSFLTGNKNDMASQCVELARRGFVAATISYRLGWDCDYTNFVALSGGDCFGTCNPCLTYNLNRGIYMAVQDAHAAMRFAYSVSSSFGIDTNWMFASGTSAGSITSLLLSTWSQAEAEGIVGAAFTTEVGPLNGSGNSLPDDFEIKAVVNNCGAVLNVNQIIDNENLPIVSFHDSNDIVIPYASGPAGISIFTFGFFHGSSLIHGTRLPYGECSELHTVAGSASHCSFPASSLVNLASCFLKRVMCGVCVSYANTDIYEIPYCSSLAHADAGIAGCTYNNASNYNSLATVDNGTCVFTDNCPSDINNDGVTNIGDLLQFIAVYGTNCP